MSLKQIFSIKNLELKLLFKNSSWVLSGNLIRAVIVFVKGIIVARGLGVELFGTFNIIAAFAGLVHQFFSLPLSSTIIKYGADYLTTKQFDKLTALIKSGFVISFVLACLSTLVIILLTLLVYDVFLEDPDLETYVAVYAVVAATSFIDGISSTLLRLFYKFKENSFVVIASAAVELLIVGLVVYFNPKDFMAFFIAYFASKLIASALLNGVSFRLLNQVVKPFWNSPIGVLDSDKKKLINYTLANSGSRALRTFINNGDVLLLGAMLGPIPVAFYNIAKKLAQAVLIVIDPITHTLFPQLSLLISERQYDKVEVMIKRMTSMILLPAVLGVFTLYILRAEIIYYTYGSEYLEAVEPFLYLAINAILGAVLFWHLPLILSLGMVKFRFYINAIALVLGGVFAYFTVETWGASAVAIGLLIGNGTATIIFSLTSFFKIKKKEPVSL